MGLSSKQVQGDEGLDWSEMECLPKPGSTTRRQQQHSSEALALDCPRCGSTNTKFCYYNNYNKSQPRHFCKACKRHWTKGGTLRNVPVGGGRKNKRLKAASDIANSDSVKKKNSNISIVQQHQHQHQQKKNISDILYQALIKGSDDHHPNNNNNNNGSLLFPLPTSSEDQQSHQFSLFSSLTPFDDCNNMIIPSTIPTFHQSFIMNDEDDDFYDGKKLLDSAVESSAPAANNTSIFCQPPALGPTTEMQNYCWNWNVDIDTLVSADDQHLNIPLPWDDDNNNTDMKP